MQAIVASESTEQTQKTARSRSLQILGILCGFTAGAWLGAAEAPTKLVTIGISPIVISLIMAVGVFLARWSLPALVMGTSLVRADVGRAPHLVLLGAAGRMPVGSGQYADDFRDPRYWTEHCVSAVELQQPTGNSLRIFAFQ